MADAFAFATVWPYLVPVNKYSPLVSEFGSAEEDVAQHLFTARLDDHVSALESAVPGR